MRYYLSMFSFESVLALAMRQIRNFPTLTGFLDEMEYRLLLNAIQDKVQMCRHKGSLVAPSTPEVIYY